MSDACRHLDPVYLWDGPAPHATGMDESDRPRITGVLPEARSPTAAIVVCPGGGYCRRAPHEGLPVAKWLAGLGLAAFVLDYRVRPYRHPVPLTDALRAIRMVRARADEWNVDAGRVGILGFSAGGHLAVSAATLFADADAGPASDDPVDRQPSRPDALIACYAVVTFGEHRHHGSMVSLLGDEPDPELRQRLSLENAVSDRTPPTFIWQTADDGAVPVENALLLAGALRTCGVPLELHVYPHGAHGIGLSKDWRVGRLWSAACAEWLDQLGWRG